VILSDGYNVGQKQGLNLTEYVQVSYLYNYMDEYFKLPDDHISQADIMRAI